MDPITKRSELIYRFKCGRVECEEYIGQSSRTFGGRFKKHLNAPSPIYDHCNTTGHTTMIVNFSIVGKEDQSLTRTIKESICIRVNNPSLNKSTGKYHLTHIGHKVLFNNPELKINHPFNCSHSICHTWHNSSQIAQHISVNIAKWPHHLPQWPSTCQTLA